MAAALTLGLPVPPAAAAGGYAAARMACRLADPQINESSGVAAASWGGDVIWTHNDSGDAARFFAVSTTDCATLAIYEVAGAEAVDWEDMARSGATLHFGDIGDNAAARDSITIYDVPEPARGARPGAVRPSATRVLTYPDGPHNAEALLVDPTTGQLVVVTKVEAGGGAAYRAPASGGGTMERIATVEVPDAVTGGDAGDERLVVRDYLAAYEWDVRPGDTLAGALARRPATIVLPLTLQGEAIAYAGDGEGLWTTSEREGAPVHFLARAGTAPAPAPPADGTGASPPGDDSPWALAGVAGAAILMGGLFIWRWRGRR